MTTGKLAAMAFCPTDAGSFVETAESVVSVAAPVGNGRDAAETGTALWLLAITTGELAAISACPNAGVFVSMLESEPFPVVCAAEVAAPLGSGSAAADIGTAPWSDATTTGRLAAIAFWPTLPGNFADIVVIAESVAAPEGNGKEAAETGIVV